MIFSQSLFPTVAAMPGASMRLAIETDDLKPLGSLDLSTPLVLALTLALALAAAAIVAAAILSRPRRKAAKEGRPTGSHRADGDTEAWKSRVNDVTRRHHDGLIDREAAFTELAALARAFSSLSSGRSLASSTLTDIAGAPRTSVDRQGLDALRMTIAALYPPQFADARVTPRARDVSVDEAAGWVLTLIERWSR